MNEIHFLYKLHTNSFSTFLQLLNQNVIFFFSFRFRKLTAKTTNTRKESRSQKRTFFDRKQFSPELRAINGCNNNRAPNKKSPGNEKKNSARGESFIRWFFFYHCCRWLSGRRWLEEGRKNTHAHIHSQSKQNAI